MSRAETGTIRWPISVIKPNKKTEGVPAFGLSFSVDLGLFVQLHERFGLRSVRKQRQEADQDKQTYQNRNENHQKQGHNNLLSRVKNGY